MNPSGWAVSANPALITALAYTSVALLLLCVLTGLLALDLRAHEVRVDGAPVAFTARELELLAYLAEHPRQVFTREQLFKRFWGEIGDRHTVTVHIGRIREKIEADPDAPRYIATVWGVGYRFEGVRR